MGQFVLKVRDLDEGITDHRFVLTEEWLAHQLADVEGIDGAKQEGLIEVAVTRRGREVLIRGSIRASLRVDCVRCLEAFPHEVDAPLEVLMLPGQPRPRKARETDGDDKNHDELGIERYRGDEIELDEILRDTILLEVPMNPNCGEQCLGWDHLRQESADTR